MVLSLLPRELHHNHYDQQLTGYLSTTELSLFYAQKKIDSQWHPFPILATTSVMSRKEDHQQAIGTVSNVDKTNVAPKQSTSTSSASSKHEFLRRNPYEKKIHCISGEIACPRCPCKIIGVIQLMKPKSIADADLTASIYCITKQDLYGVNLKACCPACGAAVIIMWRLLPASNQKVIQRAAAHGKDITTSTDKVNGVLNCPACGDHLRGILEFGFPEFEARNSFESIMPRKKKRGAGAYDIEPNPYDITHSDQWGENNLIPCPRCEKKDSARLASNACPIKRRKQGLLGIKRGQD